jgi:hypothetical protein
MKSLIWKELRQLAPWAGLMLLATVSIMIAVMVECDPYYPANIPFAAWIVTVFCSIAAASLIGFLQSVLEIRRDQWAFLLHRGLSASQLFVAKIAAGLLVYALVIGIPAIIAVVWWRWPGIEQYPTSWHQVRPLLLSMLASPAFYFAALLAVVWKGPWHVSRLLPIASPCLVALGTCFFGSEITEFVPITVYVLTDLSVVILGVATWGIFIRSGEAPGRPRLASACLGVPVFVAMFGACIGVFTLGIVVYEWYLWHHTDFRLRQQAYVEYSVSRQGHVLKTAHELTAIRDVVTDLDAPLPNEPLPAPEKGPEGAVAAGAALPMGSARQRYRDAVTLLFGRPPRTRVLQGMGVTGMALEPDRTHWVFSSVDGWIYGYQEEYETRNDRRVRLPPRLVHVVGPDGFTAGPAERPSRRFGNLLANSADWWSGPTWLTWPELTQVAGHIGGRRYLLFDDGLFVVDTEGLTVERVLAAPAGRQIRSLTTMGDAIAVVYHDSIAIHSATAVNLGQQKDHRTGETVDAVLKLPGALLETFPIPKEIAAFEDFDFGRLPGQDVVVFKAHAMLATRIVEMDMQGTVLRSRDFQNVEHPLPEAIPPLCGVALFAPLGPTAAACVADAAAQLAAGTGSGLVWKVARLDPGGALVVTGLLIAMTALCVWSARRTAGRYKLDNRTRRVWLLVSLLLGPAGLLTLWLLRDWPARERCPACSQRRPVTLAACPHCSARAPEPGLNGTEIIMAGELEPAVS